MGLRDRLQRSQTGSYPSPVLPGPGTSHAVSIEAYQALKGELHKGLIDKLDLRTIDQLTREQLREELRQILGVVLAGTELPLNRTERETLFEELLDEVTGLGPLEPLLRDPSISDILVNGYNTVYVERFGKLELTSVRFRDNEHLTQIINRIVARVGRRVDDASPMADARLADGSRVNAIIPPLAIDGPVMSIRRFGGKPLRFKDMLRIGSITPEMVGFLGAAVQAKLNILISGGTGTGKTTMLNAMSSFIPDGERVVTIEDAAELQLQQRHVVRLETRPPNIEGRGEVLARDLVKNALRMRPDRIIIGECRGGEILDMLQAMEHGPRGLDDDRAREHGARRPGPRRVDGGHGQRQPVRGADQADHRPRHQRGGAADPRHRRAAPHHQRLGDHGHGRHRDHAAGDLPLRPAGHGQGRQDPGRVQGHRPAAQGDGADRALRHQPGGGRATGHGGIARPCARS